MQVRAAAALAQQTCLMPGLVATLVPALVALGHMYALVQHQVAGALLVQPHVLLMRAHGLVLAVLQ